MLRYFQLWCCLLLIGFSGYAQIPFDDDRELNTSFLASRGIIFSTEDSLYSLQLRFRMQNRFVYTTRALDDLRQGSSEMLVRRLRLRLNGNLGSKKLSYAIQLGFTVEDMDGDLNQMSNIIRDAMAEYKFSRKWSVGFGQTKLPGNRERVNSSSDLQLVERSLLNRTFNIDRDFGLFVRHKEYLGKSRINLMGVISSGEGRNVRSQYEGYCFTGRVEWLPFGEFTAGGDYFQGDLMREPKPKLSIGIASSINRNAGRTGGQIGPGLPIRSDLNTHFADLIFKYRGFCLIAEGARRTTGENGQLAPAGLIYTGYGINAQASYCTPAFWECVVRATQIFPSGRMESIAPPTREIALGVNRYLRYHRVKLQGDVSHLYSGPMPAREAQQKWMFRFQIEVGI